MKIDPELKIAITHLPDKEKDKLIFRLIRRDEALAKKLYFELVSGDSVETRRVETESVIRERLKLANEPYYSPGIMMMRLRDISATITDHVKTTKDRVGEVSLNLLMLNEFLDRNNDQLIRFHPSTVYTLGIYIISKAFKIMILIKALHEDYFVEFEDDLHQFGKHISANPTIMKLAIRNGLDVNWLLRSDIPDDIKDIQKHIRAQGLLR